MERNDHSEADLIDLGPAVEQTKGNDGVNIDQAQQKLQSGLSED
ncbi:benenodin family lasso peptide [Sphingobium baderi]|jgi:hypothetical protein|nr:benenodin family lasso peptide [Sphingobium baderi]